jgi:hypothetical protein
VTVLAGVFIIAVFAAAVDHSLGGSLQIAAVGLSEALAVGALGALLGFLFGIPRTRHAQLPAAPA